MMSVLRIASESFDVDGFMVAHPDIEPDVTWHSGERRLGGTTRKTNGLNLFIAEAADWTRLLQRTTERLRAIRVVLEDARSAHARMELDFALEAGETKTFTICARLAPDDLRALSDAGITLCVTVYPASKEGCDPS